MKSLSFFIVSLFSFVVNSQLMKEIKIGEQIWTSENLNTHTFRNGDVIKEAKSLEEWKSALETQTPAWCYFNNDPNNASKYGKLYNIHAVKDPRGLAPQGWHICSRAELESLINFLGGRQAKVGLKLRSKNDWIKSSYGLVPASNSSGFNGMPGGLRDQAGVFESKGIFGVYWTSTTMNGGRDQVFYELCSAYEDVVIRFGYQNETKCGFSVRLVKD